MLLRRQYLTPIKILSPCFPYLTKHTHAFFMWINTCEGGRATLTPETGSATPTEPTCLVRQWVCLGAAFGWCIQRARPGPSCQYPAKGTELKTRACPRRASGEVLRSHGKGDPGPSLSGPKEDHGYGSWTRVNGLQFNSAKGQRSKPPATTTKSLRKCI